jgi:hypothetical protein
MDPSDRLVEEVKQARVQIDDYMSSVRGLHAFAEAACYDDAAGKRADGSHFSVPRTMTPAKGDALTPDAVVQPRLDYGIIAEMKKHYRDGNDDTYIEQVKKYDQDLLGWWTKDEKLSPHDLVLLTHLGSATKALDAYEKWTKSGKSFQRPFAIVEYAYTEGADRYFMLRRRAGALTDKKYDEELRQGKHLAENLMIRLFAQCKLYDARPPLIHMLFLLYFQTLPLFLTDEEFEASTGKVRKHASVTVAQVRDKMEEQFYPHVPGPRQPKLPKKEWVQEALDALQDMELAKRDGKDKYHVLIAQPGRKDALSWLVAKRLRVEDRKSGSKPDASQGDLFSGNEAIDKGKKQP